MDFGFAEIAVIIAYIISTTVTLLKLISSWNHFQFDRLLKGEIGHRVRKKCSKYLPHKDCSSRNTVKLSLQNLANEWRTPNAIPTAVPKSYISARETQWTHTGKLKHSQTNTDG